MSIMQSAPLRCGHCGAPLAASGPGQTCSFCKAAQPDLRPSGPELRAAVREVLLEDRNGNGVPDAFERPRLQPVAVPPQPPPRVSSTVVMICVIAGIGLCSGLMALIVLAPRSPVSSRSAPRPIATPLVTVPAAPVVSVPPAPTLTVTTPSPVAKPAPAPAPAAPKLTNEQYASRMVANAGPKLKACIEQHLLRNANAPTAYTVTGLVEQDGLPRNSETRFSPPVGNGKAETCMKLAIFYSFGNGNTAPPKKEEFTYTASYAFPNAQPATKRDATWD